LRFWRDLLGFTVVYERPEEGFAFLDYAGAQVMLEERGKAQRTWETGPLQPPLGRGINFEIRSASLAPILSRLAHASWPLYMPPEEKWYRVGDVERGQRQFLVQDPDGYLLRFAQPLGTNAVGDRSLSTPTRSSV
jgi:catechol 2,3-dioxygenase-like lactoylglutathione lyase family enzyme